MDLRYIFTKAEHYCPNCEQKEYQRYVDRVTGKLMPEKYGSCNREEVCGYEENITTMLRQGKAGSLPKIYKTRITTGSEATHEPSFHAWEEVALSMQCNNRLLEYMHKVLTQAQVEQARQKYYIGGIKNKTVFWQIDIENRITAGQTLMHDPITGKRKGDLGWMHSANFKLSQCLFGEHLLRDNTNPVALVEGQRTAVFCSVVYPEYTWLATCGMNGLSERKCEVLKGRRIYVSPDKGAHGLWQEKLSKFLPAEQITISSKLENIQTLEPNSDLLDWMLLTGKLRA